MQKMDKIWFDGALVDWDDANIHVLSHSLHYGLAVFEGIRAYQRDDGATQIFRLRDHIRRLFDGAHITTIDIPFTIDEVIKGCEDVVKANKLRACYLRPIVWLGYGQLGLGALNNPTHVALAAWPWGSYLGDDGINNGIRAKVASFNRMSVNANMVKAKVTGQYVNSILAKREVMRSGYDEAILLDAQGYVSEASGENIFVIRDGTLFTPGLGSSLLNGITRDTIITLAHELGLHIEFERLTRDFLYIADEIFMVGTAAEVTPVREVDDRQIGTGAPGPITRSLQTMYFDIVKGSNDKHNDWLHFVDVEG